MQLSQKPTNVVPVDISKVVTDLNIGGDEDFYGLFIVLSQNPKSEEIKLNLLARIKKVIPGFPESELDSVIQEIVVRLRKASGEII